MTEVATAVESLAPYTAASARRLLLGTRAVFAGVIALGAAGVWFYFGGPAAPAALSGSLGLAATLDSSSIQLSWDPASEDIRRGRQGMVSIVDGKLRADIPLHSRDLSAGRISYVAASRDVEFRLKVLGTNGKWSEGKPLILHLAAENRVSVPSVSGLPEGSGAGTADRSSAGPVRTEMRIRSRPIPEAPEARFLPAPINSAGLEMLEKLSTSARPLPPAAGKPTEPKWTPPITSAVLVQHVPPIVPPDLQRTIDREVRLPVRLSIDESGNVIAAQQLDTKGTLADSLFRVAAETVRQWKYQPARLLTQPIATMVDVEFRFAPSR